jgi:cytochrome c-type biogenesis protein CcmH/NrfF
MKLMIEEKESQVQNITKQLHCSEFKCQKLQVIFDSSFKLKKKSQEEVHKLQKLLRTRENEEVIVVKTEQEELPHFTDFLSEAEELDD